MQDDDMPQAQEDMKADDMHRKEITSRTALLAASQGERRAATS